MRKEAYTCLPGFHTCQSFAGYHCFSSKDECQSEKTITNVLHQQQQKKCSDEIWMLIPVSLSWVWQVVQPQGVVFCADRIVVKECRCLCARMRISLDILTWFSGQSCWICVIQSGAGWYYVITHYLQLLSTLPAQSLSVWSLIFFCIINKLQTCCFETQTSPNGNLFSSVVCLSASSFCF